MRNITLWLVYWSTVSRTLCDLEALSIQVDDNPDIVTLILDHSASRITHPEDLPLPVEKCHCCQWKIFYSMETNIARMYYAVSPPQKWHNYIPQLQSFFFTDARPTQYSFINGMVPISPKCFHDFITISHLNYSPWPISHWLQTVPWLTKQVQFESPCCCVPRWRPPAADAESGLVG